MPAPAFPHFYAPATAQMLLVADQIARFERLAPAARQQSVVRQLGALLAHAAAYSPFWRERLAGQLPFQSLPPLTRAQLQQHAQAMRARSPDMQESDIRQVRSSGSTGRPVAVERYQPLYQQLYQAQHLRFAAWHGLDAAQPALLIQDVAEIAQNGWGAPFTDIGLHGRLESKNLIGNSPEQLWDWLAGRTAPTLFCPPGMAMRLARLAAADPVRRAAFDSVVTFGESLTPEVRGAVRAAFGARMLDRYSCEEAGWLAFQCPRHEHYHVLSSNVLVEIVDDDLRQVAPGQEGRVLVTSLHSYAMPLIRYDIGDRAVAGAACDCGITLPVIAEIRGRERSFIRLPDGSLRQARLTGEHWRALAPVREFRLMQHADGRVEALVVPERPLRPDELASLEQMLRQQLHPGLRVAVTPVAQIDWGHLWKRIDVLRAAG